MEKKPIYNPLFNEDVLRGYEDKDDKLHYLITHLANLTLYFGIYNHILKVIFELCRPEIKSGLPGSGMWMKTNISFRLH